MHRTCAQECNVLYVCKLAAMQHTMRRITVITFIMNGEKLAHVGCIGASEWVV